MQFSPDIAVFIRNLAEENFMGMNHKFHANELQVSCP